MKNWLKNSISIFVAAFFLFSTTGFSLVTHVCNTMKSQKVGIFSVNSCCTNSEKCKITHAVLGQKTFNKTPCCKDVKDFFKVYNPYTYFCEFYKELTNKLILHFENITLNFEKTDLSYIFLDTSPTTYNLEKILSVSVFILRL